jgi:hypothetical protein
MLAGARKPPAASAAACNPAEADQPGWSRFVQAPSARNSIEPEAWLPAIPSARQSPSASSPKSIAAAAAAPNAPHVPVGWNPRA